eukprot:2460466-Amphidinium_carterae.1
MSMYVIGCVCAECQRMRLRKRFMGPWGLLRTPPSPLALATTFPTIFVEQTAPASASVVPQQQVSSIVPP